MNEERIARVARAMYNGRFKAHKAHGRGAWQRELEAAVCAARAKQFEQMMGSSLDRTDVVVVEGRYGG